MKHTGDTTSGNVIMLRKDSGAMLTMVVFLLLVVTVLALAVMSSTVNALKYTKRQRYAAEAFNIAESGAGETILWLQQQTTAPTNTSNFTPSVLAGNVAVGSGFFTTVLKPDANNNVNYLKTYTIVCVGTSGPSSDPNAKENVHKTLEVVWRQGSFGQYAYFTDAEKSPGGSTISWKAGEVCDGPAHSNNANSTPFNINYNGSTSPIFTDFLSSSAASITYQPSAPTTTSALAKVYSMGSKGYMLSAPVVKMPDSSAVQQNAAWGDSSAQPTTTGVYVRTNKAGGIYIVGDASIVMSRDTSGRQVIAITQSSKTTTITVNLAGTTTYTGTVGSGSASSPSSAVPNGVIYCTGAITGLSGEITDNLYSNGKITARSAWTIATNAVNGKDVTIGNNLYYHTEPDKTKSATDPINLAAATLGVVAHGISIPSTAPTNLKIDAVLMAGNNSTTDGSFQVTNYGSKTPVGTLTINGGIIQKVRGSVGTFNSSTGQTSTGYTKNYHYDPRLATNPPPFYPTTGTYDKLSWRMLPATQ